ncbi:acyl-CoA thioesterase [Deinococcus maricopensis]|uniref:Thioesterase superfamily protein n=1 Tax=Deinococcus maricopensis (strain DSM 21211 / LMG 22137 / NRRL B-23946 / LB-34) TaxID=709986 RepID=E8U3J1_DEIML|nr:thioesterase family protein [Deinococcus maricopensis]ADV68615.1 thioesterase superfamily protein [Deinococcus maricopensis DSM 21211]
MDWNRAQHVDIQQRYSDADQLGHLNNAVYVTYLETARVQVIARAQARGVHAPTVVAHLELDYRREIKLGQRVTVQLLTTRLGRTSWTYHYRVLADDVVCAEANTVQVHVDLATMRAQPLPDALRAFLLEHADPAAEPAHAGR